MKYATLARPTNRPAIQSTPTISARADASARARERSPSAITTTLVAMVIASADVGPTASWRLVPNSA
jgi:hypothetical protein